MENMELGPLRAPEAVEGPEHELAPWVGSPQRCVGGSRDCEGWKAEAGPGTIEVITDRDADPVERPPDAFDVIDQDPLVTQSEGINESLEGLCSPPCNDSATLVDPENGTGTVVPVWSKTEYDNENGNATRVEGELDHFDRDKGWDKCKVVMIRQSSLATDCSSIDSSSKPVDDFHCSFLPQDNKVKFISSGTKWMDEACGNYSEVVQTINSKDDPEVAEVHCVWTIKKPHMDILDEQSGEKEVNAPFCSEERNTYVATHSPEKETAVQVHFQNEMCQSSPVERGSYDQVEGVSGTAASSCAQDLASLAPSVPGNALEDCRSNLPSTADVYKGDTVAVSISSNCCMLVDNGGKGDLKSGSVSVVRRRNPKRAASSRNNQCITKSHTPTRSKSSAKTRRHAVNICALLSCGTSTRVTKKRCHSWKRARVSVWGALANLMELFKQNEEFSQPKNKRSKKGRSHGEARTWLADRRASTSYGLRAKHTVSTDPVFLQDNMYQCTLASDSCTSLRTDPNDCLHSSDFLTVETLSQVVNGVESISGAGGCSAGQLSHYYRDMENQVHEQHAQHGDKDPESSVTQDVSAENTVSDYHGVQSREGQEALLEVANGRLLLDPGTSPDSGVLHPAADAGNITNEGATSTCREPSSRAGVVGQNTFDAGSPVQENLHANVLILSQAPSSVSLQGTRQHTFDKTGKRSGKVNGKKHGKTEENGYPSSENTFEGKQQGPCSNVKAGKPSRNRSRQKKKDGPSHRKVANRKSTVKASEDIQKCDEFPAEHSFLETAKGVCSQGSARLDSCLENHALSSMGTKTADLESMIPETLSSSSTAKGQKLHRGAKARARKSKLTETNSARPRRRNVGTQKKHNMNSSMSKGKAKEKMQHNHVAFMGESQLHNAFLAEQGGLSHLISETKKNLILSEPDESDKVNVLHSDQHGNIDGSHSGNKHASKYALSSWVASVNNDLAAKAFDNGEGRQSLPRRSAWVRCDDCYKWRSIPVELADIIDETNCRWTCKDNSDMAFADCTIPQEKTNAQINAELEISDASCEEDSFSERPNLRGSEMKPAAVQQYSWVLVKNNMFLHRSRKTQTIDEIMVCQCKPPPDGSLGCGDECLNRVLNIECVPGTCPCGKLCSNQQFQKRKYAKLKCFRCGKKGFGLQLLEDVSEGQFLIEYVGEVLDLVSYDARQREYASRGQKHFYFMTLNGNEVIDACAKGNLGRFINHSCEPNCRTEKWMVNGEVSIGLFAIRDIKKGEEVTFDYNYVRVFGAAAKRCVCGSAECRGYIGGDPLNTEIIVQGDSDEEYPEPVMILEDGGTELRVDDAVPKSTDPTNHLHEISVLGSGKASKTSVVGPKMDITLQSDDAFLGSSSDGQPSSTLSLASKNEVASGPLLDDKKYISNTGDDNPYASGSPRAKSSRSSCPTRKKICSSNKTMGKKGKKPWASSLSHAPVCTTGHFEGVEEKLNELLDGCGGISKRRDASKGYLKLLFLTAASGDNVKSEMSQSTRDLSLILDALLKTKSTTVLVDIINKNGLQMLHNIMKQNRKNLHKIPIIRKLLKVLEFLAEKEILTPEHINNIPSHAGVESFNESIKTLTHHNDIQVKRMAKNFSTRWLPRTIRKVNLSDRENGWLNSKRANSNWFLSSSFKRCHGQSLRDSDAICVSRTDSVPSPSHGSDEPSEISSFRSELASTSAPSADRTSPVVAKARKRKSRWDQPSDAAYPDLSIEERTTEASAMVMRSSGMQTESGRQCTTKSGKEATGLSDAISTNGIASQGIEEVPPGFGPSAGNCRPQVQSDISMGCTEVVAGHLQERYYPQLSVSYGIPLALVEQLGSSDPETRADQHHQSWVVAPGVPFHPFPPLPPRPRGETNPASCCSVMADKGREETRSTGSTPRKLDSPMPVASGERLPLSAAENGAVPRQPAVNMNWSSNVLGKRLLRPDRWNNHRYEKFRPPWPRERNGCRFRDGARNGMSGVAIGSIQKKMGRGFCFPEGGRGENVPSTLSELSHRVQ